MQNKGGAEPEARTQPPKAVPEIIHRRNYVSRPRANCHHGQLPIMSHGRQTAIGIWIRMMKELILTQRTKCSAEQFGPEHIVCQWLRNIPCSWTTVGQKFRRDGPPGQHAVTSLRRNSGIEYDVRVLPSRRLRSTNQTNVQHGSC